MKLKWTINDTKSAGWILLVAYSHALRRARPLTSPHARRLAQWSSEDGTQIVGLWWLRALIHRLINSRQTIFLLFSWQMPHIYISCGVTYSEIVIGLIWSLRGVIMSDLCVAPSGLRAVSEVRGVEITRTPAAPTIHRWSHNFFFFPATNVLVMIFILSH